MAATYAAAASIHQFDAASTQQFSSPFQRLAARRSSCRIRAAAYKEPQVESLPLQSDASTSYPLVQSQRFGRLSPNFPHLEPCPESRSFDEMIHSSIVEIVKNLKDAPFLHYVFNSSIDATKPQRQKLPEDVTSQECWNYVRLSVLDLAPDGLIYVQKLDGKTSASVRGKLPPSTSSLGCTEEHEAQGLCEYRSKSTAEESTQLRLEDSASDDIWGVLVQGKNGSACYILKTTRVLCAVIGAACTRFYLTKAHSLGPSVEEQLRNMWLIP